MNAMNQGNVSLLIVLLTAVATLGMIGYCVVAGLAVPAVVMTLLGVVLGFLGSHLSSAQGASQALQQQANTVTLPLSALAPAPAQQQNSTRLMQAQPDGSYAPADPAAAAPVNKI